MNKENKTTNLFGSIKKYWLVAVLLCVMVGLLFALTFVVTNHTWNTEAGVFVRAEVHPERVLNVTWIKLENQTLMYGTCNTEVLDLVPGRTYEFGEGLVSGNFGKRLVWIKEL